MLAARPQFRERVGSTLADKYKLVRLLGIGGMAAVYEAENTWTGRKVAIKLLTADTEDAEEHAARFMEEARAATKVQHPHIVQILDMGQDPLDGTLFIVEEFLTGQDLRSLLDERGSLPPRAALEIIAPVMSALSTAHGHGIVHRDIKPANIFLAVDTTTGKLTPKLIDFGVVKKVGQTEGLTKAGTTIGTPEYMSPEQAHGDPTLDAQTDVWSTAVVLYEMFNGSCPFQHENYHSLLVQILWNPVPRLTNVPADLADVVQHALERDRARRFKNMGEFLTAILACPSFVAEDWHRALASQYGPQRAVTAPDAVGNMVSSPSKIPPPMPSDGLDSVWNEATEASDFADPTTKRKSPNAGNVPAPIGVADAVAPAPQPITIDVATSQSVRSAPASATARKRIAVTVTLALIGVTCIALAIHTVRHRAETSPAVAARQVSAPTPSSPTSSPTLAVPSDQNAENPQADAPNPSPGTSAPDLVVEPSDATHATPTHHHGRSTAHRGTHANTAHNGSTHGSHHGSTGHSHGQRTSNGAPILGVP